MKKEILGLPLSLALLFFLFSIVLPAIADVDAQKDNRAAIKATNKPLKTKVPSLSDHKPARHIIELNATQTVKPLGPLSVEVVRPVPSLDNTTVSDDTAVVFTHPPLEALISLQDNLNPFSLDAHYSEALTLENALNAALDQNLDIENNYSVERIQKYQFLSTASKFLPDLNAGYSLFGVHGSIPGVLFGATSTTTPGSSQSIKLPGTIQLLNAGFTYKAYQGGKVLFGTLEQKHRLRAARAALKSNINDVLLGTAQRYFNLLLNEALLEIRTQAVAISKEQLRMNTSQEKAGTATGLDVLQSEAQLASDEQNLIEQQNIRRQSSLQLTHLLNTSFAQDLIAADSHLQRKRLLPKNVSIDNLLSIAVEKRPELKKYEALRLAAKRAIIVAGAPLQPNVALSGSVFGIGVSGGDFTPIFDLNFGVKWFLGSLGTTDIMNIQQARWQARQTAIQAKQAFLDVFQQVRSSYDTSLASDKRIDRASIEIRAAEEELRIASKRMQAGIGLNIDVLNAQRDLTQARINKARATIDFNIAQAQLLHDIGLVSVDTLVHGVKL